MSKKTAVMLSTFLFSIAITLIDAFVHPNYFVKIPIKILFFLALPMLFFLKNKDGFGDFKGLFRFRRKGILKSLLLGLACMQSSSEGISLREISSTSPT